MDSQPYVSSGTLLGMENGTTLEVTYSYPYPMFVFFVFVFLSVSSVFFHFLKNIYSGESAEEEDENEIVKCKKTRAARKKEYRAAKTDYKKKKIEWHKQKLAHKEQMRKFKARRKELKTLLSKQKDEKEIKRPARYTVSYIKMRTTGLSLFFFSVLLS